MILGPGSTILGTGSAPYRGGSTPDGTGSVRGEAGSVKGRRPWAQWSACYREGAAMTFVEVFPSQEYGRIEGCFALNQKTGRVSFPHESNFQHR